MMASAPVESIGFVVVCFFVCLACSSSYSAALEVDSVVNTTTTNTTTTITTIVEEEGTAEGSTASNSNNQTMLLGVYFESRCPDSRRFFLRQLVPTYRELASIMALQLVPFGHARTVGDNKMICQHGQRECEGNRLMACVQVHAGPQEEIQVVETLGCLFEGQLTNEECVKKHLPNASFDVLEKCKTSDESYKLMQANEVATGRVDYIPKLTFNGEYLEEIQSDIEYNLKAFICKKYTGPNKPAGCTQEPQQEQPQFR